MNSLASLRFSGVMNPRTLSRKYQTRLGSEKLDGAEFHFRFQAKPAVTRKIIAWKKSCEKRAKKKRDS